MADYFSPTVIQQAIPDADMTALERLVLGHIFDAEPADGGRICLFSETGARDFVILPAADLRTAFAQSANISSSLRDHLAEAVASLDDSAVDAELDLSGMSWEFILQDIVRRSATLEYVTAVSAFTCSKMRPDGFGGMAVLITADAIKGKSTSDILEELLAEIDRADPALPA